MNKLRLYTGQHPLKNDDFDFLQAATKQGLDACISAFVKKGNGYLVLEGCEPTLNTNQSTASIDVYDVSEGYMVYDNEIMYCPVQQISVPSGAPLQYQIDEQFAPSGTRQYGNSTVHECHVVRKVIVEEYNQQGAIIGNVLHLNQAVSEVIVSASKNTDISNLLVFQNGWTLNLGNLAQIQERIGLKNFTAKINSSANFNTGGKGYNEIVAVLPINFRPLEIVEKVCAVRGIAHLLREVCAVKIYPNGNIEIEKFHDVSAPTYVTIDIMYY